MIVRSVASSAPTISCVLWPPGANFGAARSALASSMCSRRCAIERRIVPCAFLRRQPRQARFARQLDVDADAIGIATGLREQLGTRIRNRLEMDVAAEIVLLTQRAGDAHELLHRVVGIANHAGAEKQAFDVVAAVEVERQLHHLFDAEARARRIAGAPVDAVQAVVDAEVGEQDLQQRDAAAVGRVAVADAHALGRAHAAGAERMLLAGSAGSAGCVVLGRVRQHRQLTL